MNRYACSVIARKSTLYPGSISFVTHQIVGIVEAASEFEAEGKALQRAREVHAPTAEGWVDHQAMVMYIPDLYVEEMAQLRAKVAELEEQIEDADMEAKVRDEYD